jgi:hypothetical protein
MAGELTLNQEAVNKLPETIELERLNPTTTTTTATPASVNQNKRVHEAIKMHCGNEALGDSDDSEDYSDSDTEIKSSHSVSPDAASPQKTEKHSQQQQSSNNVDLMQMMLMIRQQQQHMPRDR